MTTKSSMSPILSELKLVLGAIAMLFAIELPVAYGFDGANYERLLETHVGEQLWFDFTGDECRIDTVPGGIKRVQIKVPIQGFIARLVSHPSVASIKYAEIKFEDGQLGYMGTIDASLAFENLNGDYFKRCVYPENPEIFWQKVKETKRLKMEKENQEIATANAKKEAQAKKPGVRIGMTRKQVREQTSWGEPADINTTVTRSGTSEQWVFEGGSYLYFTNGKLTEIQN